VINDVSRDAAGWPTDPDAFRHARREWRRGQRERRFREARDFLL
jgi:hypothetical protein